MSKFFRYDLSYWIGFSPLILLQLPYSGDFNVDAQVTGYFLFLGIILKSRNHYIALFFLSVVARAGLFAQMKLACFGGGNHI